MWCLFRLGKKSFAVRLEARKTSNAQNYNLLNFYQAAKSAFLKTRVRMTHWRRLRQITQKIATRGRKAERQSGLESAKRKTVCGRWAGWLLVYLWDYVHCHIDTYLSTRAWVTRTLGLVRKAEVDKWLLCLVEKAVSLFKWANKMVVRKGKSYWEA